jgi:hypothetical protein
VNRTSLSPLPLSAARVRGGREPPTLRTGGKLEKNHFALSWGAFCGGSRISGAAGMIAGDSLTGWDGAGFQAQGLLPRNEGNLEGGNMCLVERAVGTIPRMEEVEGTTYWQGNLEAQNVGGPQPPTQSLFSHLC